MSKVFKDIGKDSRDLFSQDFPSGSAVTVIAQTTTPNGIVVKPTLKRYFKKEKSGEREFVEVLFEPKLELKERNLEFNAKVSTAKDFTGGATIKDLFLTGTKLELNGALNEKEGISSKATASFKNDTFSTLLGVNYPFPQKKGSKQPVKVNGELVVQYPNNWYWGSNFSVDLVDSKPKIKGEGVVGYYAKDWQATSRFTREVQSGKTFWGVSFFHKLSSLTKFAIDFDVDASETRGPIAQVGGEYKLNVDTTLKGKLTVKQASEPEYRLALSSKQQISKYFLVTYGADFNVRQLLGTNQDGESHSFGLELKFQE